MSNPPAGATPALAPQPSNPLAATRPAMPPRRWRALSGRATLGASLLALALLAGCQRGDPQADVAARAAASEAAAEQAAAAFDKAVVEGNWALAKAQGEVLLADAPDSKAAQRVAPRMDEVRAKADAAREGARTAALWSYNRDAVKGGTQLSAAIYAREELDTDGSGPHPVRLIFRDHPSWGRSSYLVLQAGDFRCPGGCTVKVAVDGAAPRALAATRPDTDEAIAMFIEDERALWRMLDGAKRVAIEFPVKAGGTRTAEFEVAGLERTQLPEWK